MNDGKICVSICAETAGEMRENIGRAEKLADVIELRFDCLNENELEKALSEFVRSNEKTSKMPFLIVFRPKNEGGKRDLSLRERIKFWERLFFENIIENKRKNLIVDVELDLRQVLNLKSTETIASLHDFSGESDKLPANFEIYKNLTNADVIKFAVPTSDIGDSIAVWKLLEKAKREKIPFVPIAMGESGKWTRILGLAHGAPLAYAALEAGKETAAGQFTWRDLSEVYRVKKLNAQTEVYGVVGSPVSHSLSPYMHNAAFRFHNLNAVYIPFAVENLDEFIVKFIREQTREIELNIKGFSVTIPHKQTIIKHLDATDETARKIGAVNTVKIENGKLCGFNTDAAGFIEPLKFAYGDLQNAKVAVFGAGGAARAAIYALKNERAIITVFARNSVRAQSLAEDFDIEIKESASTGNRNSENEFGDFDILVNATPLGTAGELERETPAFAAQIKRAKLIYDLIYNPFETAFIREARKAGVPTIGGLAMLVAQGMKQFEIWTNKDAPMQEMSRAVLKRIKN